MQRTRLIYCCLFWALAAIPGGAATITLGSPNPPAGSGNNDGLTWSNLTWSTDGVSTISFSAIFTCNAQFGATCPGSTLTQTFSASGFNLPLVESISFSGTANNLYQTRFQISNSAVNGGANVFVGANSLGTNVPFSASQNNIPVSSSSFTGQVQYFIGPNSIANSAATVTGTVTFTTVPEPSSFALGGLALLALCGIGSRRRMS